MARIRWGQTTRPDPDKPKNTLVEGRCTISGTPHSVSVPTQGLMDWLQRGTLIQVAMPQVSAEDREFLISGSSPEGWRKLFSEDSNG